MLEVKTVETRTPIEIALDIDSALSRRRLDKLGRRDVHRASLRHANIGTRVENKPCNGHQHYMYESV